MPKAVGEPLETLRALAFLDFGHIVVLGKCTHPSHHFGWCGYGLYGFLGIEPAAGAGAVGELSGNHPDARLVPRGLKVATFAGGRVGAQLVNELFSRAFDNDYLRQGNDGALLDVPTGHRVVMATDAHVISPLFFPGGDIGSLSVHGTVNDVAMLGAQPLYLSASFILEEGFPLAQLKTIVESMAAASRACGVPVVTGDTKVVERGKGDGVFITTTGVGVVPPGRELSEIGRAHV